MNNEIQNLNPQCIWKNFYALTQVPRPSGHLEKIQQFLLDFGKKVGVEAFKDPAGNIVFYYIYQSKSGQAMKNSVSPASLRVVEIKRKKDLFTIQGFLFGFTCEQLFSSNSTALSIEGDNCYFYYNYDNKHEEQTVNGLTCLTIHLPTFSKNGRMKGIYCGYCNNKAGTLEFVKISKEEFDIYMGGFYEER